MEAKLNLQSERRLLWECTSGAVTYHYSGTGIRSSQPPGSVATTAENQLHQVIRICRCDSHKVSGRHSAHAVLIHQQLPFHSSSLGMPRSGFLMSLHERPLCDRA